MKTVVTMILVGLLAAPALAGGRCIRANVHAPMVFPDGSIQPPGVLRLCDSRAFTPVSSFHAVSVDGHAIGMLTSRKSHNEMEGDGVSRVVFHRQDDGRLALIGYVVPGRGGSVTYRLADPPPRRSMDATNLASSGTGDTRIVEMPALTP
jgi:hypothetical protein